MEECECDIVMLFHTYSLNELWILIRNKKEGLVGEWRVDQILKWFVLGCLAACPFVFSGLVVRGGGGG